MQVVHPTAPGKPFTFPLLSTWSLESWDAASVLGGCWRSSFHQILIVCTHVENSDRSYFHVFFSIHRFLKESPGKPCSTIKLLYCFKLLKVIGSFPTLGSSHNGVEELKQHCRSPCLFSLLYKQRHSVCTAMSSILRY